MAELGLRCRTQAFSHYAEGGCSLLLVRGLLTAVAALLAEHRSRARELRSVAHGLRKGFKLKSDIHVPDYAFIYSSREWSGIG